MGQTRRPEVGAERLRQGHHGTAEHQSGQQPAHLGARHRQEAIGDATAKIGHGGGRAIQHPHVFHPQLGVDATLGQSLSGAGQQRMGRDPGSPEQATHLQAPALLEGGAGGETKGGGALQLALQLQHAPAGFGGRTQVGLKATAKPHALAGIGAVQEAQWVAGTRGGCAEAKQEQEAGQSQQHRQGGPARDGPEPGRWTALGVQGVQGLPG